MKHSRQLNNPLLVGVVACFVLSGFAALLYQTAWLRQFSLVFGTSELAVAAVLSAYMAGLSLGASLAARFVSRITRPVLFYGLLEAGIAISALAVPLLLQLARLLYVSILGGQPEPVDASGLGQSFFYLIIAFLVLCIPTTFMGATLPLLTKYIVQTKEQIGSRVGLLYATNTLGAIGGTVVAAFILLPRLGLNGTVWVGVAINLLVFVLAALISRSIGDHSKLHQRMESAGAEVQAPESEAPRARLWILPLILFSGANSFVYEVLWTRLLGHILGGSITAFATMLAGFLSGIAIGSAIASRFAKTRTQAIHLFIAAQCGIAVASILVYQFLPLAIPDTAGLNGNVIFAILVLLPATIFIGATFPLAVRILASSRADAGPASAKIYSWNTIGAIAGATLAAFFLIPFLKYEGAIKAAIVLNACLSLMAATLLGNRNKSVIAVSCIFVLSILLFYQPKMPEAILRASPVFPQPGGEIVFYEVGRSATVVVIEENGLLFIRTNGLPEAASALKGSPPSRGSQLMLSVLPVLARPDTESTLIVGLGGGIAVEAVPASVASIDVIELEPEVVRANEFYGARKDINPLDDPRVSITINDARSALTLTDKKYDSMVSQPSHPWTAGASHLYTREFMQLAKNHLTEDGVYLQWMNSGFVDEFLLKSLCATMLDVFPYVRMYQFDLGVIFLIGSEQPLNLEQNLSRTGRPINEDPLGYLERGIGSVEDLMIALTMDQKNIENFAAGAPLITDNNNYMATKSALVSDAEKGLVPEKLYTLLKAHDPLLQTESWFAEEFDSPINFSYITRRLSAIGAHRRSLDLTERLFREGNPQAFTAVGLGLQSQGNREESQNNLRQALALKPEDQQARYAFLQAWFADFFSGNSVPDYVLEELSKLNGSAADVFQGLGALEQNDVQQLVELDAELAAVLPTDLWYTTSVKLRAEWRIQLTSPEYQPRMVNEATALIDSAITIFLDVQLYMMRIRSTYLAEDYAGSMETARSALRLLSDQIDRLEQGILELSASTIDLRINQLDEIASVLLGIEQDGVFSSAQLESTREYIEELKSRVIALD
jgi:spermidine synthase